VFDHHVEGDSILDTAHHGGPDKAAYAYAREDAAWWASELGRDVPPGSFGENLSTSGWTDRRRDRRAAGRSGAVFE